MDYSREDKLGRLPTGEPFATVRGTFRDKAFSLEIADTTPGNSIPDATRILVEDCIADVLTGTTGMTIGPLRKAVRSATQASFALIGTLIKDLIECEIVDKDMSGRYPTYRIRT